MALAAEGQPVEAAPGLQPAADGLFEIQLAAVTAPAAALAQLGAELLGHPGDEGRGPGDVRVLELGDVPVQQGQVRVQGLAAHGGVLHHHLLLQQEAHEDGADEVAVELGAPLQIALGLLQELPQVLPLLLRHGGVDLLEVLPQVHGLAAHLQLLLRLRPPPGQLLRLGLPPGEDGLLPLLADEEAVEGAVEGGLLLAALGVHGPEGVPDRGAVRQVQDLQHRAGVRRLLGAHRQPLLPQQGGELRQLLHIDGVAPAHHSVLGTFRVGRS